MIYDTIESSKTEVNQGLSTSKLTTGRTEGKRKQDTIDINQGHEKSTGMCPRQLYERLLSQLVYFLQANYEPARVVRWQKQKPSQFPSSQLSELPNPANAFSWICLVLILLPLLGLSTGSCLSTTIVTRVGAILVILRTCCCTLHTISSSSYKDLRLSSFYVAITLVKI